MSLYIQQKTTEDQILENYVTLWRYIIGDKKFRVDSKPRACKPLDQKQLWRKELRTCAECKKVKFYPRHAPQKYCGNRIERTGCAYQRGIEGVKKALKNRWKKD